MNRNRYANLERLSSEKLGCPSSALQYEFLGDDLHRMTCGERHVDHLLYCRYGGGCTWMDSPAQVAAFDLNCPQDQLEVTMFSREQAGVTGCARRARYVIACQDNRCSWLATMAAVDSSILP